jgi:hypothetical protein
MWKVKLDNGFFLLFEVFEFKFILIKEKEHQILEYSVSIFNPMFHLQLLVQLVN